MLCRIVRQSETLVLFVPVCGGSAMEASIADGGAPTNSHTQKLFVMRHGERWDDANPTWVDSRMWDPPLTDRGWEQATEVGRKFRSEGVQITRILVSPFLRCVQTTAGFIKGYYPEGTDNSKLKVSVV